MRARTGPGVLLACLLLAACGQEPSGPGRAAVQAPAPPEPAPPASTGPAPAEPAPSPHLVPDGYDGPLGAVGLVLEDSSHDPQLCTGAVAASDPPQCRGLELAGWDWSALEPGSYESKAGSRYGDYFVVGTVEGDTLTLTQPPRPPAAAGGVLASEEPREHDFGSPCPTPPGGWKPVDPARATDEAFSAGAARAEAVEGYAGSWMDQNLPAGAPGTDIPEELANDPQRVVLNVRTVGDREAMKAAVREVWGGALCISPAQRTEAEVQRIADEVFARYEGSWGSVDVLTGTVEVGVPVARVSEQRELDERYGPGVVRLRGALQPVPR
ncbi:hypothetical protein CLV92_11269 [Kineococcus xinjiangensis]|uniref:Uncharacterized protein n=1 Tax=Kineococcus xinjiangensis TaxID=512762 RepID=A0A2S6IFD4_9ACTN|nr:hypothetical protein [Kineococcus xinjiangensis]PPK92896.1 hypothetical protein CLV92_11269 [Kineococcus xinjiangensis]